MLMLIDAVSVLLAVAALSFAVYAPIKSWTMRNPPDRYALPTIMMLIIAAFVVAVICLYLIFNGIMIIIEALP
jgi:hypothetical protein